MLQRCRDLKGRLGLFCAPRTGKTLAALSFLEEHPEIERVLVVCPLTAAGVWREEAHLMGFRLPVVIAAGGSQEERVRRLTEQLTAEPNCLLVINYQPYGTARRPTKDAPAGVRARWQGGAALLDVLERWRPQAILADECTAIKNRTAAQSKALHIMGRWPEARVRIGLTGTPITNNVQDLFSIYKFIDPEIFGWRWVPFADRYLTFGYFNEITGSKNDAEIRRKIETTAIQVARSEAWGGLPTRRDLVYPVVLSEASTARYRQLAKEMVALVAGRDERGQHVMGRVTADLVITLAMRLHQLTGGHTRLGEGQVVDVSSEKIDAACDLTEQALATGEQVVLFCTFRREIARLTERLSAVTAVEVLAGGSGAEERAAIVSRFAAGATRVLVCQNQVASKAIDLAAASVGIVVSTGYSLDDFEQLRERLTGIDPTRSFDYYYLVAQQWGGRPTINGRIYAALARKQQIAGRFLDLDYAKRLLES